MALKTLTGRVTSTLRDKTITVTVTSRETHPLPQGKPEQEVVSDRAVSGGANPGKCPPPLARPHPRSRRCGRGGICAPVFGRLF